MTDDSNSSDSPCSTDSDPTSAASSDSDELSVDDQSMVLYLRSRNLSGDHSICPQLMDFCCAGVECWGKFYKSYRPFETKLLIFEPLGGSFTHDAYLRLVLAMYRRYHKSTQPGGNSSSKMLGRLRQTVGREIRRRSTGGLVESVDKAEDIYAEKLRRAREDTAAVQDGTATEDQTRRVLLMRQTKQGYADLARYCWANDNLDPNYYSFVPDLYKTGWKARQLQNDVLSECTQSKIEARRLAALELGLGNNILTQPCVQAIVNFLKATKVAMLMEQNFGYIGVTKYQMGVGRGFDREVVRWAAVDGGCLPALTARDKTIAPLMCKKSGCRRHLEALGFTIEVLYHNVLCCNIRSVETGLHVALKDSPNRLWRCTGSGSYRNRPEQIQEQIAEAWLGCVFIVYAPISLKHTFEFAPSLPLHV